MSLKHVFDIISGAKVERFVTKLTNQFTTMVGQVWIQKSLQIPPAQLKFPSLKNIMYFKNIYDVNVFM